MKVIIIDDEQDCCDVLATLLERYCPDVSITKICTSAEDGLNSLMRNGIDLAFLDIKMPHMTGFELLERLHPFTFSVVFTTSYDQYAIKAIRYSALDYLLKPVDKEELQVAVRRATERLTPMLAQQLELLVQKMNHPAQKTNRIALPTMEGLNIISADSIISCTSSSNYTILSLKDGKKLTISRTLKEIEEMLEGHSFFRVHHSYLVNLAEVRKYIRGEGGLLIMSDESSVDVSRSKKDCLLRELGRR